MHSWMQRRAEEGKENEGKVQGFQPHTSFDCQILALNKLVIDEF